MPSEEEKQRYSKYTGLSKPLCLLVVIACQVAAAVLGTPRDVLEVSVYSMIPIGFIWLSHDIAIHYRGGIFPSLANDGEYKTDPRAFHILGWFFLLFMVYIVLYFI